MTFTPEEISPLVDTVGTSAFEEKYCHFVNNLLNISQCTVFQFSKNYPPRCVLATGTSERESKSAKTLAREYTEGEFVNDPNFPGHDKDIREVYDIHETTPSDISNSAYRARFYEASNIADELILFFGDKESVVYVSFYRSRRQERFTKGDIGLLTSCAELIISLLRKHIELSKGFFTECKTIRNERYKSIMALLLQSKLSEREAEICSCIVLGYTTLGISLELGISTNTVATHRKRAYTKLGISSQNELFAQCFDLIQEKTPI